MREFQLLTIAECHAHIAPVVDAALGPQGFVNVRPMLWVNSYRPEWPVPYIMKEPITLPAGTRLVMTAYYDNKTAAAIAAKPSIAITALPSRQSATLEP